MPDIKTKNVVKGTVKTIDKSAVAAERMKDAYIRTKDKAEHGVYSAEGSAEEYAADRISGCADTVTREAVRQFDKQGRRGVQSTKNNISKAKEHFRQRQAQKSIKTLERGEKTIKQTAKSTGKSTIKTAKGSVKTAQKTVKTAEQTARTAIKTSEQAAKVAQKTAQASAKAARTAAQAAKATAKATVATIKAAAKATVAAVKAIIAGTKALISAIAAGGWVAVVIIIVVCLIALIVGSCFGIFFSGEDSGSSMTMQSVVQEINTDYQTQLDTTKTNISYDVLEMSGSRAVWPEVLAVYAVKTTTDDVLICDPENEFGALAAALGKETATVIHMAAGGKDRLNAMYMVDGYGENNPIVEKSQFIMSLVEQIDKAGVGPQQKSIIDRCTALVYQDAERTGKPATLCDLRNKLLEQPEEKAKEIALSLELFTTGSLDIFGHESTVDLDKRIVVFDIHGLGEQLKPTGLLVITDTILNRVTLNWKKGKRTHIFIDEFHVVFENEQSGIFFNSAWRQFRKRNGYPTAITQNVEYLLDSVQASTMLSNSEFVVMLNQAFSDRAKLSKLLNISDEQMSYVTNADAGCGLIKYGSALVPFINRFPKDTELYRLMTTRPGEGVFGSRNAS